MTRFVLKTVSALAFAYALVAAFLIGWLDCGVALAISAGCVIAEGCIDYARAQGVGQVSKMTQNAEWS